jgi:hypothetical protein
MIIIEPGKSGDIDLLFEHDESDKVEALLVDAFHDYGKYGKEFVTYLTRICTYNGEGRIVRMQFKPADEILCARFLLHMMLWAGVRQNFAEEEGIYRFLEKHFPRKYFICNMIHYS